ncbi:MAG: PPA1309 family protein, partial [Nocardioides sp.]
MSEHDDDLPGDLPGDIVGDLDVDPALASAVLEIEGHIAEAGWDQPARLYALVETARLVEREPDLAAAMGLDESAARGSLTPVEQDQLTP